MISVGKKLTSAFYQESDVIKVARNLIGKVLITDIENRVTSGMIVETEAYSGRNDKACHANEQRRTVRTEIMFGEGGSAYVYLCYGIHHLFNVVTNTEGSADAVLIRALQPLDGIEIMLERRKMEKLEKRLTAGPGVLTEALGITTGEYGTSLLGDKIWIEDRDVIVSARQLEVSKRIGVDYADEDAHKLWRFYLKENLWVSKIK